MSALPLLVEWGSVISKLVVGGLAVGAVLGYRAVRNHRDVKAARADAGRMSLSVDEPREGPIAVAGIYHVKGDDRWLDCSGQRVVLVGELAIVRGSSATWKNGTRTYALRDGDGVVAIGVMSRRAGDNATDYRESAGGWQLAASPGELGVQVCLVKPVPCPKPLWPIRGVLVLGVVGVAAYYGLGVVGKKLVESRKYPREAFLDGDGASTFASQIACALPRYRDHALTRYAIDLEYQRQTEDVIDKRVAIALLLGDCYRAVLLQSELGRFEQAVATANECGHPEYGRASLVTLGRYDEAAKITTEIDAPYADDPVVAMIGAGRWREAAAHVETQAHRDAEGARCFARYLRSVADGTPLEPSGSPSKTCRLIDGNFREQQDGHDAEVVVAGWAFADGPPDYTPTSLAELLSPHAADDGYGTHALRATLAMDLGHIDAAAREIEQAQARIEPSDDNNAERRDAAWRRRLPEIFALRTGKPFAAFERDPDFSYEEDEAALLRGGANPHDLPRLARQEAEVLVAIVRAMDGDGLPLAELHERANDRLFGLQIADEYLLALAPLVKTHREDLARAVRNRPSRRRELHEMAVERDILRMLGDDKGAARLQAIVDRTAKALGDREKLKAMLLAEGLI